MCVAIMSTIDQPLHPPKILSLFVGRQPAVNNFPSQLSVLSLYKMTDNSNCCEVPNNQFPSVSQGIDSNLSFFVACWII